MNDKTQLIELSKVLKPYQDKLSKKIGIVKEYNIPYKEVQSLFAEINAFLELLNRLNKRDNFF